MRRVRGKIISQRPSKTARQAPVVPDIEGALDDLALFQEMRATLLPQLRAAVESGKSSAEIMEIGRAMAVARLVSMAALEPEANLGAIKEILERIHGKVTDKREIVHPMSKLKDEELDALLLSAGSDEGLDDDE